MTFEQQITKLCSEAIACKSEEEAVELVREIQTLMHKRIEELRGNLITLPPLGPTNVGDKIA